MQYIERTGCKIEKIKSCGFAKAEITFLDIKNTNECLDLNRKDTENTVKCYIPNRVKRCRGVLKDWDIEFPIHKLAEAIDDNKNIFQIERMTGRRYDVKERKTIVYTSHLISMTFEGSNLPIVYCYMEELLILE